MKHVRRLLLAVLLTFPAFASAPVREDLEQAARTACADKGLTLRALVILYDEQAEPTGGRLFCGPPTRQDL